MWLLQVQPRLHLLAFETERSERGCDKLTTELYSSRDHPCKQGRTGSPFQKGSLFQLLAVVCRDARARQAHGESDGMVSLRVENFVTTMK